MYTVLLSGGRGKRLWPLSNEQRSKQFFKLLTKEDSADEDCSMVQRVWSQLVESNLAQNSIITASSDQMEIIRSQLGNVKVAIEPERRNTFPAVVLSCAYLKSEMGAKDNDIAAILPVDIFTEKSFFNALKDMESILDKTNADIALMGAKPTFVSDKFGYIIPDRAYGDFIKVKGFKENPDKELADKLIAQGALWDCGVYCFRIGMILQLIRSYGLSEDYDTILKQYGRLPKTSFDYRILEPAHDMVAVSYEGTWNELGTWASVSEHMREQTVGDVKLDAMCDNTQVINELNIPIVAMGARDMVIVAALDGILVADKLQSSHMKEVTRDLSRIPMYEERRWGTIKTIDSSTSGESYTLTRKIKMYSGCSSSYHYHRKRDEVWTVISGSGELILEGARMMLKPGSAVSIRKHQRHAVRADQELEYIEIHIGEKIGNDDINRITFKWNEIELARIL